MIRTCNNCRSEDKKTSEYPCRVCIHGSFNINVSANLWTHPKKKKDWLEYLEVN